jgi:hypothetical protein
MPGELAAQTLPAVPLAWRVEVQKRGRYWQWRMRRADKRKSRYGGKFELLSEERQAQYVQNKEKRERQELPTHNGTGGGEHLAIRHRVLPASGDSGTSLQLAGQSDADPAGNFLQSNK